MEDLPRSAAAKRVLFVASSIAAHIARAEVPAPKDLFLLSAAVVEGVKAHDPQTLELSIDTIMALRQQLPKGEIWESCRGHLDATMQFAWLLLRTTPLHSLTHAAGGGRLGRLAADACACFGLSAHDLLSELDEMAGLTQGSFELGRAYVDEPVVGGVLDVDQLTELAGRPFAAGRDLFEQQLGVVVAVGARPFPSSLQQAASAAAIPARIATETATLPYSSEGSLTSAANSATSRKLNAWPSRCRAWGSAHAWVRGCLRAVTAA